MESRFIAAPTSGITKLRNTADSKMNESTTTSAMNKGSLAESTWAKSTKMAVFPPTSTFTPLVPYRSGDGHVAQVVDEIRRRGGLG